MKRYFRDKHIRLYLCLIGSIYFLYAGFTQEKPLLLSDLVSIQGTYTAHSFRDRTGFRKQGHEYYIWINQYPNAFQVKADYLGVFNDAAFSSNVKPGDPVELTIPKTLTKRLGSDENIFIMSIQVNGINYLTKNDTITREKKIRESYPEYLLAGMFLIMGLLAFYIRLPKFK